MRKTSPNRAAFTTIELLVVIGIIVLLISILVPVVGRIRDSAKATSTRAFIAQLTTAIEQYYGDFRAYPGPIANNEVRWQNFGNPGVATTYNVFRYVNPWPGGPAGFVASANADTDGLHRVTMSENLVLGLLGGLRVEVTPPANTVDVVYDPRLVGKGPLGLNPGQPKSYPAYIEPINLSWQDIDDGAGNRVKTGAFFDEASGTTGADDSIFPEFVDRYTDPMPILYLRAKVGAVSTANPPVALNNSIVTDDPTLTQGRIGAYDISQIIGYTKPASGNPAIGVSRKPPRYIRNDQPDPNPAQVHGLTSVDPTRTLKNAGANTFNYPYDAYPYFRDPGQSNPSIGGSSGYAAPHVPRQKDKFILISAGPDRIYGTDDDITSFGSVTN